MADTLLYVSIHKTDTVLFIHQNVLRNAGYLSQLALGHKTVGNSIFGSAKIFQLFSSLCREK